MCSDVNADWDLYFLWLVVRAGAAQYGLARRRNPDWGDCYFDRLDGPVMGDLDWQSAKLSDCLLCLAGFRAKAHVESSLDSFDLMSSRY